MKLCGFPDKDNFENRDRNSFPKYRYLTLFIFGHLNIICASVGRIHTKNCSMNITKLTVINSEPYYYVSQIVQILSTVIASA